VYDVLTHVDWYKKPCPILIACSKRDLASSFHPERIQATLEAEITKIRETKLSSLQAHDDKEGVVDHYQEEAKAAIECEGEAFAFKRYCKIVKGANIQVCGYAAIDGLSKSNESTADKSTPTTIKRRRTAEKPSAAASLLRGNDLNVDQVRDWLAAL
jgi:hypothetical protein